MHLYIHIPYCKKKCLYCDFLSVPVEGQEVSLYVKSLLNDIILSSKTENGRKKSLSTVYIGGGTPGIIDSKHIEAVMECVRNNFALEDGAEITIELNPCTICAEKLDAYKRAGINRISMGVQSFNDKTLKTLGRAHSAKEAVDAYRLIRRTGFENVSLDLISCVPGEDFSMNEKSSALSDAACFSDSLELMIKLNPEHISVYQLIVEEGTPFYKMYGPDSGYKADEDSEAEVYLATSGRLKEAGYEHYEISNFAKPGYRSRHNSAYWLQEEYIGCGAGATGFLFRDGGGVRIKKTSDISAYISNYSNINGRDLKYENEYAEGLADETKMISESELSREYIMLKMRLSDGICEAEYMKNFGKGFDGNIKKTLEKYMPGYIIKENGRYRFTEEGFLVSNTVLSELL